MLIEYNYNRKHAIVLDKYAVTCHSVFKNKKELEKNIRKRNRGAKAPGVSRQSDVTVNHKGLRNSVEKGGKMKSRDRQRANRRLKEELLDLKDSCGVNDPTPYEAVREIIQEFRKNRERGKRRNGLYKNVNRI